MALHHYVEGPGLSPEGKSIFDNSTPPGVPARARLQPALGSSETNSGSGPCLLSRVRRGPLSLLHLLGQLVARRANRHRHARQALYLADLHGQLALYQRAER